MAAPIKWFVPDASAGGDGDSYETAYNDPVVAFAALNSTYYILNIVPTLTGVIPSTTIALSGLKGTATTFWYKIRLTDASGNTLPYTERFILDGNNSLLNCLQIINCTLVEISGLTFKRATQDNIQGLTTASTYIRFKDCDSMLAGRHGAYNIPQSAFGWEYYRGEYSNNVGRAITYLGSLNVVDLYGLLIKGNATVGNDFQLAFPAGSSLIDSVVKNGIKALEVASANSLISNTIFDNHSVSTITNSTSVNKYSNLLIKNSPIGIVGGASNYKVNNITYYNVTNPRTATTGKPLIGTETIETTDPTDANLNYKAGATTRRQIVTMDGFYYGLTAGTPGADVIYPRIDSVSPNVGSTDGGTSVTITGEGFTGKTAGTIGGVALTDFTVVGDTSITAKTGAMTAGQKDVVITGITLPLTGGFTAQAGASAPGAITLTAENIAYRRVNISWQGGSGFSTYTLYRDDVEIFSTSTKNEYEDNGLAVDTSYVYKIVATNDQGTSEASYTIKTWAVYDVPDDTPVGQMLASIRSAILEIKEDGEFIFADDNVQVGQIIDLDSRDTSGFPCVEIYPGRGAGQEYESQRTIMGSNSFEMWLHVYKENPDRNSGNDIISMKKIGSAIIRQMYSFIDRKTEEYPCKGFVDTNANYEEVPVYEMYSNKINSDGITISFRIDNEDTQL